MTDDDRTLPAHDDAQTASFSGPPASDAAALPTPARIGEIELIRELGRGGMGVVWLGRDCMLGRDVAVKLMVASSLSRLDREVGAFIDGARAAAQVRSPNLTEIYSAGVHEGTPYIIMQYSPGRSLTQFLKQPGGLTRPASLAILREVCRAAADLHEGGVVHGDIKPSNVLIEPGGKVLMTDFGLSVSRPRELIGSASEAVGGTPVYMSPELFDGSATYQSDVYAIGMMAFEMLHGHPAFSGSFAGLRLLHRQSSLPWKLSEDEASPALREVIERATHKSPRLRYRSGRHLLEALERAIVGPSVWGEAMNHLDQLSRTAGVDAAEDHSPSSSRRGSSYYEVIDELAKLRASSHAAQRSEYMPPPAAAAPTLVYSGPLVDEPITCMRCDYSLVSLPHDGNCPECAAPVALSLDPRRICFASPASLLRMHRATRLITATVFTLLVLLFFTPLLTPLAGSQATVMVATALWLLALAVEACVLWAATVPCPPDPKYTPARFDTLWRSAVRATAMAAVCLLLETTYLSMSFEEGKAPSPLFPACLLATAFMLAAAGFSWHGWIVHLLARAWSAHNGWINASTFDEFWPLATKRLWRGPLLVWSTVSISLALLAAIMSLQKLRDPSSLFLVPVFLLTGLMIGVLVTSFVLVTSVRRAIRFARMSRGYLKSGPAHAGNTHPNPGAPSDTAPPSPPAPRESPSPGRSPS